PRRRFPHDHKVVAGEFRRIYMILGCHRLPQVAGDNHRQCLDRIEYWHYLSSYADMSWRRAIIVMPILTLAWYGSGDDKFPTEVNRWCEGCKDEQLPVLHQKTLKGKGFGDRPRDIYLSSMLMEMYPLQHRVWRAKMKH